jgi:glycosyltransferase involved in cell wall biosynthesis
LPDSVVETIASMAEHTPSDELLKRELDRLRAENQRLHAMLRRFDEGSFLLRKLVRVGRRELGARVPALRPESAAVPQPDAANFPTSFRPYEVRQARASAGRRPRVLHAIANFYTGGSPRLVVDLVEQLGDRFEQVTVVRTTPPRPHYVGLEIQAMPEIKNRRAALTLLRRLRPDLIHVHFLGHHQDRYGRADWDWYEPLFSAAEAYGCAVVENVNIPVAPYFSDAVGCYVFVSDYVRSLFGRQEDRNITIYPGSNLTLFSRRAGVVPPDGCLGMVYRLERDKLDETAIDIFIEALLRSPEAKALIVGGGRFLEPYRARVEQAGLADAFTFTAYAAYDELPRLYEQMSIFVAPPHSESFGHVVPLAMGMAIPVAAYSVGALPEILGNDDALVPPGDVGALAAKVVELLPDRDRRLHMGAANRERAERLFSVEKMVADYCALYDELLGVKSSPAPDHAGGAG